MGHYNYVFQPRRFIFFHERHKWYSPDDCWNMGDDVAGAGAAKLLPFPAAEIRYVDLENKSPE